MSLVPLATVKDHLNLLNDNRDDTLQSAIDSAEAEVAGWLGLSELGSHAVTQRVEGRRTGLVLDSRPVIAVTGIAGFDTSTLDLSLLNVDSVNGVVYYYSGYNPTIFPMPWYTVTYTAGFTDLPDDLVWAVCEIVRDDWQAVRGSGARAGQGQPEQTGRMTARAKIANYTIPGFA